MTSVPATADAAEPQLWRPRIGLKSILLLMAAICILLGGYAILERKSREMVALNQAIQEALHTSFTSQPEGADFVNPAAVKSSAEELRKDLSRSRVQGASVERYFGRRVLHTGNEINISVDLSKALAAKRENAVLAKLLSQFAYGLSQLGLRQTATTFSPGSASEIWELPEHGVLVIIDTFLDHQTKQARIRSRFFHNDQATIF